MKNIGMKNENSRVPEKEIVTKVSICCLILVQSLIRIEGNLLTKVGGEGFLFTMTSRQTRRVPGACLIDDCGCDSFLDDSGDTGICFNCDHSRGEHAVIKQIRSMGGDSNWGEWTLMPSLNTGTGPQARPAAAGGAQRQGNFVPLPRYDMNVDQNTFVCLLSHIFFLIFFVCDHCDT